ncbi:monocarboxylate transporter 12-like isoform X2 [Mercenaria mercenaria]|uniref:monocarboxylate transporter 12-like isoform X2 n=1 Tax=Mercenaria mercenaria TaxID=6596 RepID=UPI00234F63DE|nr:monocarboxylate transporter 12-like isoform X2 [Mercenaria mercenaria]
MDREAERISGSQRSNHGNNIHRWFVFATAYMSMMIDVGFIFSSGALFVDIMTTFSTSRSEAALVQSVLMAVRFGIGMVSGAVVQRFGALKAGLFGSCLASAGLVLSYFATSVMFLVLSMGVILAMGSSCLFIASSVAVGQHFKGKTGLVLMSAQSAGGGLGGMLYPFVLEYLGDSYGLKGALLIVGGLYMQLIPASLLWTPRVKRSKEGNINISMSGEDRTKVKPAKHTEKVDKECREDTRFLESDDKYQQTSTEDTADENNDSVLIERQLTTIDDKQGRRKTEDKRNPEVKANNRGKDTVWESLKQLAFNPSFVLFAVGMGVAYPALGILFIFIVDLFLDAGLTEEEASLGLLLVHMFSIFGRLLPGIVMQSRRIASLSVPIFAALLTSSAMVGLAFVKSLEVNLFLCCLIGLPYGVFVSVFSVTTLKLVGIKQLSNAIGVLFTLNGLGSGLAGPISGLLRDLLGSYTTPFLIAAGVILVGAMLFCVSLQIRRKHKHYATERTALLQSGKQTQQTSNT